MFCYITVSQNTYVHQVLLLNEGCYDYYEEEILEPVTVGVYNPDDNSYNSVIEINGARFASDLVIYGDYFYVAADNKLLKYDLNTYDLLMSQDVPGIRNIAIYENYLFITKGDYDLSSFSSVIFESYLDVYDTSDLSYLFSFDTNNGPQWSTESLLIQNNTLYIGINNAYDYGNYKGIVGVVDLDNMTYLNEIDLGEDGLNPINLLFRGDFIYTMNNKNWDGSSVSIINPTNDNTQTIDLSNVSSGCGVSIIRDDELCYQVSGGSQMFKFDLNNLEEAGLVDNYEYNYYTISENPVNGYVYASIANFVSSSGIVIYDQSHNIINTFFADVATGTIAFDVRSMGVSLLDDNAHNFHYVVNEVDLLGRENSNANLRIEISNNKTIEKTYIVK